MPRDAITILHLSDPQFGKNHVFGKRALPIADGKHDTLLARTLEDLDKLKQNWGLVPDLIVLTGDLAEWGKKEEFQQCFDFLAGIGAHLGIGPEQRHRIAVIPGNHDINRNLAEAEFAEWRANDKEGDPFGFRRFKFYADAFKKFYAKVPEALRPVFDKKHLFSLQPVPELQVVLACLNSALAECHLETKEAQNLLGKETIYGHHGWCGEAQYRQLASELAAYATDEWLRIGLVHHNIVRGATSDDENLRDAEMLKTYLGSVLNLLLHGHTHVADRSLLPLGQPVLSTGSAALGSAQRPNESPNQYQVLRITQAGVEAWMRAFDHHGRCWRPDSRVGGEQTPGRLVLPHAFSKVSVAISGKAEALATPEKPEEVVKSDGDDFRRTKLESFMSSPRMPGLEKIASLRWPGSKLEWHHTHPPFLSVVTNEAYGFRSFVIGFKASVADSAEFIRVFDEVTSSSTRWERWFVVPGLDDLPEGVPELFYTKEAAKRGIRVLSWRDFERMSDLRIAIEQQKTELLASKEYPPALYISLGMEFFPAPRPGQAVDEVEPLPPVEDGFAELVQRIEQGGPNFFLIDGDFGAGKTFLLRELARHFSVPGAPVIPLLIELRSLDKVHNATDMLITRLGRLGQQEIRPAQLAYMAEAGHLLILFDGYDELALRVSFDRAADHLSTITEAACGKATVVLTCRTQHFKDDHQMVVRLLEQPGLCRARLLPFTEPQILGFLEKKLGSEDEARRRFTLIHDIKDLLGLSENPRMLSFIADLPEQDLTVAQKASPTGKITAARLYETILERWLRNEVRRHSHLQGKDATRGVGEQPSSKSDARYLATLWVAVTHLAFDAWGRMERPFELSEIQNTLKKIPETLLDTSLSEEERHHGIASGSLLSREGVGVFAFAHYSIPEFLVARDLARQLNTQDGKTCVLPSAEGKACFSREAITDLMAEFLVDELGWDVALAFGNQIQKRPENEAHGPYDQQNGARLLTVCQKRLQKNGSEAMQQRWYEVMASREPLKMVDADLRGRTFRGDYRRGDFTGADLTQANLRSADFRQATLKRACLIGADLSRCDLREAIFTGANLTSANFTGADLGGADLTGADFTQATLIGADLRGAVMTNSVWKMARLAGAKLDDPQMSGLHAFGAGLPLSPHPLTHLRRTSPIYSVARSPKNDVVVTAHANRCITLWDAHIGKALLTFKGHLASVLSVAFNHDGSRLASGSDDNSIRIWDSRSGKALLTLKGHSEPVLSVAFNHDGSRLASGSDDDSIRIWDAHRGKSLLTLEGHSHYVSSVAFNHNGSRLASGSDDDSIRIWDAHRGKSLHTLKGHSDSVLSVAFSHDGSRLASGSQDNSIRIWDVHSGKSLLTLKAHSRYVSSVAFNRDGSRLASGSDDNTIRIWDLQSCQFLVLQGHTKSVTSVAFLQGRIGGPLLVSASADGTIRIWDADAGLCLGILLTHGDAWAALRPDGRYRVVGDMRQYLWHVSGLVRYELGELDEVDPHLKLAENEPLIPPAYFAK